LNGAKDYEEGAARGMKGVSWTRRRAIHVDDQGRSGAFREREENLEKQHLKFCKATLTSPGLLNIWRT
jgi:hypothetical protein